MSAPEEIVTAHWLSLVLGQAVRAVRAAPLGQGLGLVSRTLRLEIDADPGASLPRSLVLKLESDDPAMRQLALDLGAFAKETAFYRQLAPGLETTLPRLQACGDGHHAEGRWLLLEDLSWLRAGNQVRGLSAGETAAALEAVAVIHGRFWQQESLLQQAWLPAHQYWYQGDAVELVGFLQPFLQDYELRVESEAIALLRLVATHTHAIDQALAQRPWTLVHGDLRADNLLFDDSEKTPGVRILDWGSPCRSLGAVDVACLIGGSTPMPQRRGRVPELLGLWHRALLNQGVRGYSLADAWQDLQLGCLRCLSGVLRLHHWQQDAAISPRRILLNDEAIERFCALAVEIRAQEALPRTEGQNPTNHSESPAGTTR
jgi:hypothetical protein